MAVEAVLALALTAALFLGTAALCLRGGVPARITGHRVVLSLAIFGASGLVFYFGVVEIAGRYGLAGLLGLMAYTVLFIFSPLFLEPLRWISPAHNFSSLSELLVYRYRTVTVGRVAAVTLALTCLPIAAGQLRLAAGALTLEAASPGRETALMAGLALFTGAFIVILGKRGRARRVLPPVLALAAVLALAGLSASALVTLFGIFDGPAGLEAWLAETGQAQIIRRFDGAYALILVFFPAALLFPQFFYLQGLSTRQHETSDAASWILPLLLLLATLPMFLLLWGGIHAHLEVPMQYYAAALPASLELPAVQVLTLSAGCAMAIGLLAVLAPPLAKDLVTAFQLGDRADYTGVDLRHWLRWRQSVTGLVWLGAVWLFAVLTPVESITDLTLMGLVGLIQLMPGLIGTLYNPRINRQGFLAGLAVGLGLWLVTLVLPSTLGWNAVATPWNEDLTLGLGNWPFWLLESLIANLAVALLVSRLTDTDEDERHYAHRTMIDSLPIPQRSGLAVSDAGQVRRALARHLRRKDADDIVDKVLARLGYDDSEHRPLALRLLRDNLTRQLSERLGNLSTERIMAAVMPLENGGQEPIDDITLLESHLAHSGGVLSGLAAELNKLRLYHRQTLENLPIGVCSVDRDGEIRLWNLAMTRYTGLPSAQMEGSNLDELPAPWHGLLVPFARDGATSQPAVEIREPGSNRPFWFHLEKSRVQESTPFYAGSQILLVEDVTERRRLIWELAHRERLSAVGRLAAGVAHEIGNPVTGISCLAQDLREEESGSERRRLADLILTQTDRISRIVRTLIDFSRSGENTEYRPVAAAKAVTAAIQLLELDRSAKPVTFVNEVPPDLEVMGDENMLTQVFINLLTNARDASDEGATVRITHDRGGDGRRYLSVVDQGEGIPRELLDKITEPFFTTKEPGEGTGLGLSLVYNIVRLHRGSLEIHSAGRGTRVTVILSPA